MYLDLLVIIQHKKYIKQIITKMKYKNFNLSIREEDKNYKWEKVWIVTELTKNIIG